MPMITPIPKPKKKARINRGSHQYGQAKADYLKAHQTHNGFWRCMSCSKPTDAPELDHIDPTRMGGSPSRLLDQKNWQLLCHDCHERKTNGR
jgi:5-methylcytosine-specific restriction endonuclease McrA